MFKKQGLLIVFLLFAFYQGSGQLLNSLKRIKASDLNTSDKIEKIDSLVHHARSTGSDSLAYLYRSYTYWLYNYDLPKTIALSEEAKKIALASSVTDSTLLYKINIDLGYYYSRNYENIKSISSYKQALDWTDTNKNLSKIYEQIARCYDQLKDYYRAVDNYKIAAGLLDRTEGNIEKLKILCYNISLLLSKQNTRESLLEAGVYAKKIDSLSRAYPQFKKYGFNFKFHHAEIYNHDLNLDTLLSSKLYREAYEIARENSDTIGMIETLYGRGGLFNSTNQAKSRLFHFEALRLTDPLDSTNLYLNWYALGKTFAYEGNYSESSKNLINSLRYLTGKDFSDPRSVLKQKASVMEHADDLIYNLPLLGEVYLKWFEQSGNRSYLDKSLGYFQITDKIIDYQKLNSKDFLSRLFWRKKGTDLYGKALRACFLLQDYDQAFYFMEKNKALLLMEDISQKAVKRAFDHSPQRFKREESLKKEIFVITTSLKKKNESLEDVNLQKERMNLEIELSLLQDSIYGYKKTLQYEPTHLAIEDIQKRLEKNEVFVEYHLSIDNEYGIYSNNEKGYVLFIDRKNCRLLEIGNLEKLYSNIEKLITLLKKPLNTQNEIDEYSSLSYEVYEMLFPGKENQKNLKHKKLIISPDYYLHFLPFEALSTSPEKSDYLINTTEISYVYSYSFGENNVLDNSSITNDIIAFAPQKFKDPSLFPLLHTESEINMISKNFTGQNFTLSDARKKTFIKEAPNYMIIHLATHAYSSSDSMPWISFYDEKMALDELYLTENNASLVVLSACNTNIGKLEVGEGAMSLARGFFYGGTQSVISTLWSVDDKSTSAILNDFYINLKNGQDKSMALHNAKLKYLESNSLSELSPYYWSSLVLLGDPSPLTLNDGREKYYVLAILALAILLITIGLPRYLKKD